MKYKFKTTEKEARTLAIVMVVTFVIFVLLALCVQ